MPSQSNTVGLPGRPLLLDERALALGERPERLVARDRPEDLEVVPGRLGLLGRLDLHEVHVVDHPAVLADLSVLGEEVVDRRRLHLRDNRLGLVGLRLADGLEVVGDRGVDAGLRHRRHRLAPLEELLRPGARLVVEVPVEAVGEEQPLRDLEAEAVDVRQKD
jgi:hypothetical protein